MTRALLALLGLGLLAGACPAQERYPAIRPLKQRLIIDSAQPNFDLVVRSAKGRALYRLVCRSGEYEGGDYGNFSGFFQCKLLDLNTGADIFRPAPEWNRDWTRARFYTYSIIGGCKDHPEYGHLRTFAARGMKVRIDIHDLVPKENMASLFEKYRFALDIAIDRDDTAQTPFVGYERETCIADFEKIDERGNFVDNARIIKAPAE